jgi:hypothetical protein
VPDVENLLAGYLRTHGDGGRETVELKVRNSVGVGGEENFTAGIDRKSGEVGVEILPPWEAVDLDRDASVGAGREDSLPSRSETWAVVKVSAPRVGEDVDLGRAHGAHEAFGLVTINVEVAVNGGDDAFDLEALNLGDVEGAVFKDLDL